MALEPLKKLVARFALAAWLGGMFAVGAGLWARHTVALPAPPRSSALTAALARLRSPAEQGRWLAVHALYAECRCSQRIVSHLTTTVRPTGWAEIVLWVGKGAPDPELVRRFDVRRIGQGELGALGFEAAPSLVVLEPGGAVRYSGGYTDRKQGPVIDDLRIMAEAQRPGAVAALPIFGCAVSERLRSALSLLPAP